MKKVYKYYIVCFFFSVSLIFISCTKNEDIFTPVEDPWLNQKPGLWSGLNDNNLEISLILNDKNTITRADLVFKESDGDFNRATLKNPTVIVSNKATAIIEKTVDINGDDVDVTIVVNLDFVNSSHATGSLTITGGDVNNSTNFTLDWQYQIPLSGPVRDGDWSAGFASPIILAVTIDVSGGIANDVSWIVIDGGSLSMGTSGLNDQATIGSSLNFNLLSAIDVTVKFTGFMEAEGVATLHLRTGIEDVPLSFNWNTVLPSSNKRVDKKELLLNACRVSVDCDVMSLSTGMQLKKRQ